MSSPRWRKSGLLLLGAIGLAVLYLGFRTYEDNTSNTGANTNISTSTPSSDTAQANLQLFVEPDAGSKVVLDAINNSRQSVWMVMYLLTNKDVTAALQSAAQRGVDVRVILETRPFGGGGANPKQTIDQLVAAGAKAQGSNHESFALTHQKTLIIDGKATYIMTCNFTLSALGGSSSTKNREYGVIDTNPQDVKDVADIFNADWTSTKYPEVKNSHLVVSPLNSRSMLEGLINGAQKSLLIEAELLQDDSTTLALTNAAKRGVKVQILLPKPKSASSDDDNEPSNADDIRSVTGAKGEVHFSSKLYMHAKIIIADDQKAYVGSINFSRASMERNRELGIVLSDRSILTTLSQTFQTDWTNSKSAVA